MVPEQHEPLFSLPFWKVLLSLLAPGLAELGFPMVGLRGGPRGRRCFGRVKSGRMREQETEMGSES